MKAQTIPSVEKRLSTWIELQQNIKTEDLAGAVLKPTITISRQFGCEGYLLADVLKKDLEARSKEEWTVFDEALVDTIAADYSISKHLIKNMGDRAQHLDYIVSTLMPNWTSEAEILKLTTETIFSVAHQGNAIIVGRGAFSITHKLSNCFHFRLFAPLAYRAESYGHRVGVSVEEARRIVESEEKQRNRFLAHYLGNPCEPEMFHLLFNNAKVPLERISKTIISFLEDIL